MADRRDLQKELNRINELYHQKDVEMSKAGATTQQRQMMRDMLNAKKEKLMAEMGDDLQSLNLGKSIPIKSGFKKLAGMIPLAGAGMAALSGEPAMAAEELASDASDLVAPVAAKLGAGAAAGPIGMAAMAAQQALSPSESGNPEEERQMLAEDQARKNYDKSPARMAKLKALMGQK